MNRKRFNIGVYSLLLLAFAGAIMLLDFTDNAPEAILTKTAYSLYSDTGTSYYDAPNGKETNVLYLEESRATEDMPPKKAGERWLGYGEVKVEQPIDGWAKVDIGDGEAPLYVQEQSLYVQEVPMFEGRKSEGGLSNLPPVWMIIIMGVALYFLLLMPCSIVFRFFFKNNNEDTHDSTGKINLQFRLMAIAALVYFVLLIFAQYMCGFNLDNNWFVRSGYLDSVFLAVINIAVGLVGTAALVYSLLTMFLTNCAVNVDSFGHFLRRIGFSGLILLVAGLYFGLVFLGVLVGVLIAGFVAVAIFKALSASSSKPDTFRRCRNCQYSCGDKATCVREHYVEDVDRYTCDDFEPNVR